MRMLHAECMIGFSIFKINHKNPRLDRMQLYDCIRLYFETMEIQAKIMVKTDKV